MPPTQVCIFDPVTKLVLSPTAVDGSVVPTSGQGSAGLPVVLNPSGLLDPTLVNTGVAAISGTNLVAGNIVNLYRSGGVLKAQVATASNTGDGSPGPGPFPAEGMGFVLSSSSVNQPCVVYFSGKLSYIDGNSEFSNSDVGTQVYLSPITLGGITKTAPTAPNLVNPVGYVVDFDSGSKTVSVSFVTGFQGFIPVPTGGGGGSQPSITVPAKFDLTAGQLIGLFSDSGITKAIPAQGISFAFTGIHPTNISIASNVLTVTLTNDFYPGLLVQFFGLTNASFLNGQMVQVATASGSQFTANFVHANYSAAETSGNASVQNFLAIGFVSANVASGQNAQVFLSGVMSVVTTNLSTFDIGFSAYLDGTTPGAVNDFVSNFPTGTVGSSSVSAVYQNVGLVTDYNTGTNTATIDFSSVGLTNFDINGFGFESVSHKDQPSGYAGLDTLGKIVPTILSVNQTTSTDLTSTGSTLNFLMNGSGVYVWTGTPATNIAITLQATGGVSFGPFVLINQTNQQLSFKSSIIGAINFTIDPGGSQFFSAPNAANLIPLSDITPTRRFFILNTTTTLTNVLPGQDIVISGNGGGGGITVNLPIAATCAGAKIFACKNDSGAGIVTLQPQPNDFIGSLGTNGAPYSQLSAQFKFVIIISNGFDWFIFGQGTG